MERLLQVALTRFIRTGNLHVVVGDGKPLEFGDGTGTPVVMRFVSRRALTRMFLNPELRLGEAYMSGDFVLTSGTIADLLALLMSQEPHTSIPYFARPQAMVRYGRRRIDQFNYRSRARQNVAHHYDLDARLYSLFLDSDRQYSCAYFESPDQSLDDAQLAKKRHIAAKLLIEAGSARARYRLRLGRARALSRRTLRRSRSPASRCRKNSSSWRRAAPPNVTCPSWSSSACRTIATSPSASTASSRSACSSMSASAITGPSSTNARSSCRTTASWCCIRSAARKVRTHQSLDRQIHLPRRLHSRPVRSAARDRALRADRQRHRNLAAALCRDAEGLARALRGRAPRKRGGSTTSASADVGILSGRHPRWRSATRG